jgi:dihydropteroate synthase
MKPRPIFELKIGHDRVHLGERTLVMGVVNVTPDSFSDGGSYLDPVKAVEHGLELVRQGADWLDVGGESTRPGSQPVSAEEELRRVLPVIRGLRRKLRSTPISIDTTKTEVAEKAAQAGASILNDVSGLRFDPGLAKVARRYKMLLILMHLRGRPETMQTKPFAKDILRSLHRGLAWSLERALAAGLLPSQLILDPGLGFGKSRLQNFEILAHLDRLRRFRLPLLVGTSRKSFVQAISRGEDFCPEEFNGSRREAMSAAYRLRMKNIKAEPPTDFRFGDAAGVVASILAGAHIVRVHDVASVLPAVRIADAVLAAAVGR